MKPASPPVREPLARVARGACVGIGATAPGTPLYDVGLDRGDEIVAVGETIIDSPADWSKVIQDARPGDEVAVRFIRRGREGAARMRFAADPSFKLVRTEAAGGQATEAQLAFRRAWLGEEITPAN